MSPTVPRNMAWSLGRFHGFGEQSIRGKGSAVGL